MAVTGSLRPPAEAAARSRRLTAAAVAVLLLAAVYRFNALGGALGGFDNDHFLHFAYAKQVQAGEQPLRDFLDGGLQGARPSLTYELSAMAQSLLGDNLRSEALLTVGGVALAAAMTFRAAAMIAPWYWALATSTLTILVAPKLYSYPKVLVLAVIAWLVIRYAERPSPFRAAAAGVWIAIAFLFRHDYALYCAVAMAAVMALTHGREWRTAVARTALAGATALLLVSPSVWWIERHAGLTAYVANARSMGQRETVRTDIGWPTAVFDDVAPDAWFAEEQNADAWLYYMFAVVPLVSLAAAALRTAGRAPLAHDPAILALAGMTLLVFPMFLRGNLAARFGELAPPVAVLAAALLGRSFARGVWRTPPIVRRSAAVVAVTALAGTTLAVATVGAWPHELAQSGFTESPRAVAGQTARIFRELGALPASVWTDPEPQRSMLAAQYLNRCIAPDDRVFIASYAPEIIAFADRRFAGGRVTIVPGFYAEDTYGPVTMARLSARPPLVVLVEDDYLFEFPRLREWLNREYVEGGVIDVDGGRTLRLLASGRRTPAGTFGAGGWPCFR